jgi:ABC-type transport system substrate-binding protein
MANGSYWDKFTRSRITRRRMLAGSAAVGAGATAFALVGCGGDDDDGGGGDGGDSGEETPTTGASKTGIRTELVAAKHRGGIYRSYTFDALALDTMDPHQTQFGPIYNMHSAVFSRVLQYEDEVDGTIGPDLADGMPENPDELTYIVKIRKGATFHDTPAIRSNFPQTAGREVNVDDVIFMMERQINESSPNKALYYRAGHWKSIDKMERVDDYTLRITTKKPTAPFQHYLADRNAHVVPKEIVGADDIINDPKFMIGSGPFVLDEFKAVEVVKVRRNPNWFAKDDKPELGLDRPFLDGYDSLWTPQVDATQEAALLDKQVDDTGFEDDANTDRVGGDASKFRIIGQPTAGWVNSRLWLSDKSVFKDFRLRKALHLAIDRKRIGEQIFPAAPGRRGFQLQAPVGFAMPRWSLPLDELESLPGYRSDKTEDIAEAKALWQAANGPSSLDILFAGIPTYIPQKALPEMKRQLKEALGVDVREEVDPTGYTKLAQCLLRNTADAGSDTCAFTWGFDNGWIDLDDWVYPYFYTGGTKNSFLLSDPTLDEMLDKQRGEFDYEARRDLGYEIQRYLLENSLARLDYAAPISRFAQWTYARNSFTATWFGHNYFFADVWLDKDDPNYSGRPT